MQNIQIFDKPSPHIIIDNFLQPRQAKACLEEAIKLEPFYIDANVKGDDEIIEFKDHCEECKLKYQSNRMNIRENKVVYLDDIYENKRQHSKILEYLHLAITSDWLLKTINKQGFFHILKHTTTTETILSRYGMCDFYGWHTDNINTNISGRLVTLCYYLNNEPEEFEGGELIITGDSIHDSKNIIPKHNRAVLFQSDSTTHAVDTVKLNNKDFKNGRFSVNFWIGFTNNFNYRSN